MKLNPTQIEKLTRRILNHLKEKNAITYKSPEEKVHRRAMELVQGDFDRELDLDREVNKMLDQLERSNQGEFQRYLENVHA